MKIDIQTVQKGDIVRFASYALRVESEPIRSVNAITLYGRISIDGSSLVTKRFIGPRIVEVERAVGDAHPAASGEVNRRVCDCGYPRTVDGEHGENCPEQKGACPKCGCEELNSRGLWTCECPA